MGKNTIPTDITSQQRSHATPETGSFHAGNLRGFPEVVEELGGNPEKILNSCGIDPRTFSDNLDDDVYKGIPFRTVLRLLAQAAKEVNCPHIGLILGQRLESSLLGPVGFLMVHSPTVEVALQHLIRFVHLRVVGAAVDISSRHGVARFTFNFKIPGAIGSDQAQDMGMANFLSFMHLACGKNWRPSSVSFSHPSPPDISPYRELFGMSVSFNQKTDAMFFPADCLKRSIASANSSIGNVMQSYIVQIEEQYRGDIIGQIRRILPTLLPTGKCTIERVSDLFSMHRRTLHRRLAAGGLTFEQLVDEARQAMAVKALTSSDMPLGQVASLLGYHDASAFARAFRRWLGIAPSDWRMNHLKISNETVDSPKNHSLHK